MQTIELKLSDSKYPNLLKNISNPPKQLFCQGNPSLLNKTCISIVGTRKNSDYGEEITKSIIKDLATLDIVIVSGLALGIDTIAHKTALELNLPTIAVLAGGLKNIYPPQNHKLAAEIIKKGCLISEFESETMPLKWFFPLRNRIVSGISVATIVTEAPLKSGALITARYALEQGREIYVIPGDVDRENSQGIIHILQQGGGFPVTSGKQIIKILNKQPYLFDEEQPKKIALNLTTEEKSVYNCMFNKKTLNFDQIQEKTNINPGFLLSILTNLELKNLIKNKSGEYLKL